MDGVLSFETQINKLVKVCFMTLKKLHQVKEYFSKEHLQQLVASLILSPIDYCNSLYYRVLSSLMKKLQHVQNCAVRLVMKQRIPAGGIDGVLMSLHWLTVRYRCIFKLLVIVYNCLHGAAPVEIMALIQHGDSIRTMNLRETNYSNKFGVRAFSHIGEDVELVAKVYSGYQ